ncbi:MAG: HDOD domain-containing protein [Pseudomonadota bacterium]
MTSDPGLPKEEDRHVTEGSDNTTMGVLLRRMGEKSDFPALASTISEINRIVDNDSASAHSLTQCILQDFSLTNKLLKLVNTVTYSQFGGKVNTISKAVAILGFESVRNVAMTLILFEFLQNKVQAEKLKDEVLISFFAGIVAAQLPNDGSIRNPEETMICSMFRNLGNMLATFYFFEESQQVERLMEQGSSEDSAAVKVLGTTYNELAIGIAKSWNFPPRLLAGMRKLKGEKIGKAYGELDQLSITVNLANELCLLASKGIIEEKPPSLKQLCKRYESAYKVTEEQLNEAVEKGLLELIERAGTIGLNVAKNQLVKNLRAWISAGTENAENQEAQAIDAQQDELAGITQLGIIPPELAQDHPAQDGPAKAHITAEEAASWQQEAGHILTEGIQEVTHTLIDDYKLNDLMQMVLEVMHRGMKFQRTMVLVRDMKNNEMVARFSFGNDSETLLPKMRFRLEDSADVFNLAVSKGLDLLIEDVHAPGTAGKIPDWYRQLANSESFLLLPVMIGNKAVGLFYADLPKAYALNISPRELSLLRTLRNQAVLAIKQKA